MNRAVATAALASVFWVANGAAADLRSRALEYFKPLPEEAPASTDNPLTPARIDLGRKLFFDPRLSSSGLISCNTCHNLGMGGDDNLPTSVGHRWQRGPRNAPTVLNTVLNSAQFWDGRAEDLKTRAGGPMQAVMEMSSSPLRVESTLKSIPRYVEDFERAFPGQGDPVSFGNVARAIEAFEATLLTPNAPFDRWLKGDDQALSEAQRRGLALFIDKGCVACHLGVNLGGHGYYPFGVVERPGAQILPPEDKGRLAVTRTASDEYVFRSPALRNVALTAPYFHAGRVWGLKQAVAVMGAFQLGTPLSDRQEGDITAFLESLTGDQPQILYPLLPPGTMATPRPQP